MQKFTIFGVHRGSSITTPEGEVFVLAGNVSVASRTGYFLLGFSNGKYTVIRELIEGIEMN